MTVSRAFQKPEEVECEAKKLFRSLCQPGAALMRENRKSFVLKAVTATPARVPVALVQAFARRDWIRPQARHPGAYELSDAGRGWYIRGLNPENPFAAQHRLPGSRRIALRNGEQRLVAVNDAESPITRLFALGAIGPNQLAAAEKLRRDFTLAQMMPRLTADWSAPAANGPRGRKSSQHISDSVLAAKQRFSSALSAVGPRLSDLLFDVCCHLKGIEEAEIARAWPRRSGKVMLGFALERLAQHYGIDIAPRRSARMRAWQDPAKAGGE